ncbi:hypothetical protein TNCV_3515501 [Trichonephila clavipes]|nr:hypothetical protein TNCV_3515501 [Trichonephila clavipes]
MLWGRQVAGRNYPPTNKNTLICALTEEWEKLPQQLLDNVVQGGSIYLVKGSKDVLLSYEDDLTRTMFSSIDSAEFRERFQQLQNLAPKHAFLRPEWDIERGRT